MIFDIVASRVYGAVTARDVRVVWVDGRLYVCKTPSGIRVFEATQPQKSAGTWKSAVGDGAVRMQVPTCGSCRKRVMASPVGQMSVDQIVSTAQVQA